MSLIEPNEVKKFIEDDLDRECPTCGDVGYLAISDRHDDAEPCPNCNPEAGRFVVISAAQRRKDFADWVERN